MQRTILILVWLFVFSQAFDSVIRWSLNLAGLGALIYIRDYLLVIVIGLCVLLQLKDQRSIVRAFFLLWSFALLMVIGWVSGLGLLQPIFGLKIWLPFIAGFLLVEGGHIRRFDQPLLLGALWLLLCLGVILNMYVRYPWTGLTIQLGDISVSGNREWTASGVKRLSGFSRTSYDAAIIILLLFIYLAGKGLGFVRTVLIAALSAFAIAMTTTKGAAGALMLALLTLPFLHFASSGKFNMHRLLAAGAIIIGIIGAVVPLLSLQIPFPRLREGSPEFWLFSSFVARAWQTWPNALMLLDGIEWLTGRGLGGVGAAQIFFESGRFNPADNFFIYLYINAGLLGFALYAFIVSSALRVDIVPKENRSAFLLIICTVAYGVTVNLVESACYSLVIGALFAFLSSAPKRRSDVQAAKVFV